MEMEERFAPSRPTRLGTRRRRARNAPAASETGVPRSRTARAHSLDTRKLLLKTTVQELLESRKTDEDFRREQESLRRQLNGTVCDIWQRYARAGDFAKSVKWEKQWLQLHNCQTEWIGYRAACCGEKSRPVAVPIGCNHRLCPLCAWHRSQLSRVRIKTMFDRLTHPVLITLTRPNLGKLTKHSFTLFRQRVRKLIAQHKGWAKGGVYSLETTYNRQQNTWHLHCHILADVAVDLPPKTEKTMLAGSLVFLFTAIKMRLEFDWMRLWNQEWGRKPRKGASIDAQNGEIYEFETWITEGRKNQLKLYDQTQSAYAPIPGLSDAERARRTDWNRANRSVIDLRPCGNRDGAAREVLKYITKGAAFTDNPEAVEQFCDAVRGARLIQTFGSWYGVQLDTVFDPAHMDDWSQMKCECGLNHWEKIGVFFRSDVEWTAGRSYLKRSLILNARGTVPRPTIRLPEPEGSEDTEWQTR